MTLDENPNAGTIIITCKTALNLFHVRFHMKKGTGEERYMYTIPYFISNGTCIKKENSEGKLQQ